MSDSNQTDFLPVDVALKRILDAVIPVGESELISSKESEGRILADDLNAQHDIPAFDNSALDGYIFLTKDLESGQRKFRVDGEIRPEEDQPGDLKPETCREIMTGSPVPPGNCTVVPIEMISESNGEVVVNEVPDRNPIRKQGEGYQKGKAVLPKGTVIRPYEIGLMIESGNMNCTVLSQINMAVQVTGSEINEERNSNGPVLNGLISHWPGTTVREWPVLDDDPALVKERMLRLKDSADVVLTTGGISMGKHDYILGAMEELGAEVIVRKIEQKPGKPITVTRLDGTLFFHLPGNPISAVFTAEYYARKAVYKMLGLKSDEKMVAAAGKLENHRPGKTLFVPGKLQLDEENRLTVSSEGVMKSHLMQLYRDSDVYVRLDPETEIDAGERVEVTPYTTTRLS
ncbi:molybdopterin molybdenumtransferase MoeA [Rhodohalobacter sp. SW132]|uniref:molybdopterin molybdotransferase MoeA n=1 Tax=Rhodohalobacter sp. SW132 TaxID=2293433 RepID=UPI000E24B15A|nr:molybdopterin molybdotransferase MoeA [Rhodohalobacter sp. SW132]REL38587.1 molybdopterin molybdenumtransferase MoeA [Rhodohalobacter sp. SW132]